MRLSPSPARAGRGVDGPSATIDYLHHRTFRCVGLAAAGLGWRASARPGSVGGGIEVGRGGHCEVEEVAGGWKPERGQAGLARLGPARGQGPRPRHGRRRRELVADHPVTRAGTAVRRVAFGAMTRTGSVTLIALCGTRRWPVFAGRWEAPLMPGDLPGQPYHAAAELAAAAAESMIRRGEAAAEEAALAVLRSAVADLP